MRIWIALVSGAVLLAACTSEPHTTTSTSLAPFVGASDEIACTEGLQGYNPTGAWEIGNCPGCLSSDQLLMADGQLLTFSSAVIARTDAGNVTAVIRAQEGALFPGGHHPGIWFSRSMAASGDNMVRVETLLGDRVLASQVHDLNFVLQGIKWPSYAGVDARSSFDTLRIVFESEFEAAQLRIFEGCLDHYETYFDPTG